LAQRPQALHNPAYGSDRRRGFYLRPIALVKRISKLQPGLRYVPPKAALLLPDTLQHPGGVILQGDNAANNPVGAGAHVTNNAHLIFPPLLSSSTSIDAK
jgi:hypothetical protein